MKSAPVVKDLGLDCTSGGPRRCPALRARFAKVRSRGSKAKWLRSQAPKATQLYRANLWPIAAYSVSGFG
eukprot:9511836-Lingulodinium_polyedra.AAC.1